MRGTVIQPLAHAYNARITPARAGNSPSSIFSSAFTTDHPRACGEQGIERLGRRQSAGSPPRVRGTVAYVPDHADGFRITPARAGNRRKPRAVKSNTSDHPRACGEQIAHTQKAMSAAGSPPRVRGTVVLHSQEQRQIRITPARAGNRISVGLHPAAMADHPRACGEQIPYLTFSPLFDGSPPRVRGTEPLQHLHLKEQRITPARAGNRFRPVRPAALLWDHPRACGEQRTTNPWQSPCAGSPPRVRGTGL